MFQLGAEPGFWTSREKEEEFWPTKPQKKRVSRLGLVCLLNIQSKSKLERFSLKDLWLEYIKEELSHPQGKPENSASIHWRAMKMLQEDQMEDFISKYTLLQTGHIWKNYK